MNKINSPIINKKYQHNMIMMIVAAVLVVLSFILFNLAIAIEAKSFESFFQIYFQKLTMMMILMKARE